MFTKKLFIVKLSVLAGLVTGFVLLSGASYAQTYYSRFPNPTGHYSSTNPTDCDAPAIQNILGLADNNADTYASFEVNNLSSPYSCSGRYLFDVDLNLPTGINSVTTGSQAGFRIKVPSGISADSIGKYLTVSTYLRDSLNPSNVTFQEYATGGGSSGNLFYGIDIDQNGKSWLVYFTSTKPFNLLELAVDPKIVQLGVDFEFDVTFAFGGAVQQVLPAQIANFSASVSGKTVNLSWQSLTETNVSSYRIERSNNSGATYSAVASIAAKGNSNVAVNYAYKDAVSVDGSYLYRITVVNNDGTSKATGSVAAIINGQSKLLIYPTVVKAGQNINIRTSENGMTTVYVYDAQGRLAKQQRTNSSGQFSIATGGFATGVYTIKVVSVSGATSQSRIMVN